MQQQVYQVHDVDELKQRLIDVWHGFEQIVRHHTTPTSLCSYEYISVLTFTVCTVVHNFSCNCTIMCEILKDEDEDEEGLAERILF